MTALCVVFGDSEDWYEGKAKANRVVKMFYLSKVVTVFGRDPAISRICFLCRIWCEAINCSYSYMFKFPRKGCDMLYWLKLRPRVSLMNARVRSRTTRNSASISSLSPTAWGSSSVGPFQRLKRDSTFIIGLK